MTPIAARQEISFDKRYRDSRMKALVWSAAYSLQFELGPFSEASLGNVGTTRAQEYLEHPMAFVDLVVTPVIGTGWLIGEDALDRYLIHESREGWTTNLPIRVLARIGLNPTRTLSNLFRFTKPWRRDTRSM